MTREPRLLAIAFCQSFATMLLERGIYFFARRHLAFGDMENLGLALGFGVAYVAGALGSHPTTRRIPERTFLVGMLGLQAALLLGLTLWHGPWAVAVVNVAMGCVVGCTWPVVESYVSAGATPAEQIRRIGRFNVAWTAAIPLCMAAAGPLVAWRPEGLFLGALGLTLVAGGLAWPLPGRPVHLPPDHPSRPTPEVLGRLRALLSACRWSMLSAYALMWVLAALMPRIFDDLEVPVVYATALAGLLDVFRVAAFATLHVWHGWWGRVWPQALGAVGLPVGFFLAVSGAALPVVLVGELVFGLAAGVVYFGSLYYGMVVTNASVEAGGAHEGLVGGGYALGPGLGLAGQKLASVLGSRVLGMVAGVGPLVAVCLAGAAAGLLRAWRGPAAAGRPEPPR